MDRKRGREKREREKEMTDKEQIEYAIEFGKKLAYKSVIAWIVDEIGETAVKDAVNECTEDWECEEDE